MRVRLQVRSSPHSCYTWEHAGPLARIGRNPACELVLAGDGTQTVSWEHACLQVRPGGLYLSDLRSSNGTYVNGRAIRDETPLCPGDQIRLGQTGPNLQVLEAPAAINPGAAAVTPLPTALVARRPEAPAPADGLPGTTRVLLLEMLRGRKRRLWLTAAVAGLCLLVVSGAAMYLLGQVAQADGRASQAAEEARRAQADAEKAQADARKADEEARAAGAKARQAEDEANRTRQRIPLSGQELYQRTLRSTVFVDVRLKSGSQANGTGALIDKERRLVLTAYHVVDNSDSVGVIFPAYQDGKVITDRDYYQERRDQVRVKGEVVARDSRADLALVRLAAVPEHALALPLAEASPPPGSRVHTVGNPGASAGLWAYTVGAVRQVARRKYRFSSGQEVDAVVVETLNPINKGDSGGPVVNDRAELVAVNSGGGSSIRDGTLCIDVREVRALLSRNR
jgi:S1-C subfamily serine protease